MVSPSIVNNDVPLNRGVPALLAAGILPLCCASQRERESLLSKIWVIKQDPSHIR